MKINIQGVSTPIGGTRAGKQTQYFKLYLYL